MQTEEGTDCNERAKRGGGNGMGVFRSSYPEDLREIIRHAERFADVLVKMEQGDKKVARWALGRAGEVRAVLSYMLSDWRDGKKDQGATCAAVRGYLEGLHRSAREHQGRPHALLECCDLGDALTVVADGEEPHGGNTTAPPVLTSETEPGPWIDGPEIMARVHSELGSADVLAAMFAKRLGEGVVTLDDLNGFAREGLLKAARSFDERRDVPFRQWAAIRMRNAMLDGVRRWGNLPRRVLRELLALEALGLVDQDESLRSESRAQAPREADAALRSRLGAMGTAVGVVSESDRDASLADLALTPEDMLGEAEVHAIVREIVHGLPLPERDVIEANYFRGQALEKAAAAAGRSKRWSLRVLAEASRRIETELRRRHIDASVLQSCGV